MPSTKGRRSKPANDVFRGNKFYRRLKVYVVARASSQLALDMAVAHTLADMRHICDELHVSYDIADRIGGAYHAAEIGGSLR